jgi:hypothetical protein
MQLMCVEARRLRAEAGSPRSSRLWAPSLSGLSVSMPHDVSISHGHDLLRALARLSCFAPLARPQALRFDK